MLVTIIYLILIISVCHILNYLKLSYVNCHQLSIGYSTLDYISAFQLIKTAMRIANKD